MENPVDIAHPKLIIFHRTLTTNGIFQELCIRPKPEWPIYDLFQFMSDYFTYFEQLLFAFYGGQQYNHKLNSKAEVSFIKQDGDGNITKRLRVWLNSKAYDPEEDFSNLLTAFASDLARDYAIFKTESSGWIFQELHQFHINRCRFVILRNRRGRCDLPPSLPACVPLRSIVCLKRNNHKNIGENCFVDAVTISAYLQTAAGVTSKTIIPIHPDRPGEWLAAMSKAKFQIPKFNDVLTSSAGVDIKNCNVFENENPGYFITVLGLNSENKFYTQRRFSYSSLQVCRENNMTPVMVYLLLYKKHFFTVKSLDLLLKTNSARRPYYCSFCLHYFWSPSLRDRHMENCNMSLVRNIEMPPEGSTIEFKKSYANACQFHPFAIYADSETYHVVEEEEKTYEDSEVDSDDQIIDAPPVKKKAKLSRTKIVDKHVPFILSYYLAVRPEFKETLKNRAKQCREFLPEYPDNLYKEFRGKHCVSDFLNSLLDMTERLQKLCRFIKIPLCGKEFERARQECARQTECCICKHGDFDPTDENMKRVADHCHWTGRYRGAAHNACNLNVRQMRRFFPVFFTTSVVMTVMSYVQKPNSTKRAATYKLVLFL